MNLRAVLALEGRQTRVETAVWSHGRLRVIKDHTDYPHSRAEGCRLAQAVLEYRQVHRDAKIYLVGHSAGAVVALVAAEQLPPNTVEGMALLSPSVSCCYDLRPGLRAIRGHLDVFYSPRDWFYLKLGTGVLGTADRVRAPASGRVGFELNSDGPQDDPLLGKVRHHPWQQTDRFSGHQGGHFGANQPLFLHSHVLPWLLDPPPDRK
jgi:pimeloyl-ACP methyl ester carboxylesterase